MPKDLFHQSLDADISHREKIINHAVYGLFALTPEEIALIEGTAT